MRLTAWEEERLLVFTAAELARRHRERGLLLNAPEAIAIIGDAMVEAAPGGGRPGGRPAGGPVARRRGRGRGPARRRDAPDRAPRSTRRRRVQARRSGLGSARARRAPGSYGRPGAPPSPG